MELQSLSHQSLVAFLPAQLFEQLHADWQEVLNPLRQSIEKIEKHLLTVNTSPQLEQVLRSLTHPIEKTRVVIVGQDPYPTLGHAHGLAFSVDQSVKTLPPTLRNIFIELASDIGIERSLGDLSDWSEKGVLLLNRILSVEVGKSMSHSKLGWQEITNAVAQELGRHNVVAILWGNYAGELSSYFRPDWVVQSVHPSPLSAYRGFFGSKPFSTANEILMRNGIAPINW